VEGLPFDRAEIRLWLGVAIEVDGDLHVRPRGEVADAMSPADLALDTNDIRVEET
jgi:hypothetical protein